MMYDLLRILLLYPETGLTILFDFQRIDQAGEALSPPGHIAVVILMITPEIKTHDLAVSGPFQKAADTVRKVLRVDPPGAGSPAFRENHQILPFMEKIHALLHHLLHLFPITPATDGNAFIDIAKKRQQEIPLEIRPLRQIPGQEIVL